MFDLSKLETRESSNEGAWLHITSPVDGELIYADADHEDPKPCRIKLAGADSDVHKRVSNRLGSARAVNTVGKDGRLKISLDKISQDNLELACECTLDTENLEWEGVAINASNKKQIQLMYESAPWLLEQVREFIETRSNFLGNLRTNSSHGPN